MLASAILSAASGFIFGFTQSLLIGIWLKNWDGGHGILWGGIIAISSGIAGIFLGKFGILFGFVFSVLIGLLSIAEIWIETRRK